ncbi:MAG: molybdenum cofactor guanylyltransferase [Isosphaeraceae bacterium]
MSNTPAALVLCGGASSRMGRPKAWLPFGPGEVLLQRVVRRLGEVARPIVVVAAPGQDLPTLPDQVQVVRDPVAHRGPLQGIASGLAALGDSTELVYASSTDAPFLRPEWVARLVDLIGDHDLAIPHVDGFYHPLAALYRRGPVLNQVQTLLAEDRLRPVYLTETLRARVVIADDLREADPDLATLHNLNTPEEYERALRDAFG